MSIMEQSVTLKEGQYKIALPWKNTPPYLLNNWQFVHGWRPCPQGAMGLAEPSCWRSVVSASWSCAGPCHVWLCSKISGIITQRPTSSGTWLNEQLGWCLDSLSTGACRSHGRCRVHVSPSTPHLMIVMPYGFSGGPTSWPSCANFGLQQTADDNQQEFSKEAVDSIKHNFYVHLMTGHSAGEWAPSTAL